MIDQRLIKEKMMMDYDAMAFVIKLSQCCNQNHPNVYPEQRFIENIKSCLKLINSKKLVLSNARRFLIDSLSDTLKNVS